MRPQLFRRAHFQSLKSNTSKDQTSCIRALELQRLRSSGLSGVFATDSVLSRLLCPAAVCVCVQSAPPGVPGPQSFLFCRERCCSWYSLESSQGRGPRMFFHSSKFASFNFCTEGKKTNPIRTPGLNTRFNIF